MPLKLTRVLVATELTGGGLHVLRGAGALSSLADAELHVVHVLEPGDPAATDSSARREVERTLRQRVEDVLGAGVRVKPPKVFAGLPHDVILDHAAEIGADLIVIGRHRGDSGQNQRLGSTADRLVRSSAVPCLVLPSDLSLPLRRILVPSDFSDAARGALDIALAWGAALRLPRGSDQRTVVEILHVPDPEQAGPDVERTLREEVDAAAVRSGTAHLLDVVLSIRPGTDAADPILDAARERPTDLLVLGTHGHSARVRVRIGSVSSEIARQGACPLILVPPAVWELRQLRELEVRRR